MNVKVSKTVRLELGRVGFVVGKGDEMEQGRVGRLRYAKNSNNSFLPRKYPASQLIFLDQLLESRHGEFDMVHLA